MNKLKGSLAIKSDIQKILKTHWAPAVAILITLIIMGAASLSSAAGKIAGGVFIDGVDVSGMTPEQAESAVFENGSTLLESITLTLKYEDYTKQVSLSNIGAAIDCRGAVQAAAELGGADNVFTLAAKRIRLKRENAMLASVITINEKLLADLLSAIKNKIDVPPRQAVISFDPSSYDYFDQTMDPRDMFDIAEGTPGRELDIDAAKSLIRQAVESKKNTSITLPVKEIFPEYSREDLESATSLVCHSSCRITSAQRMDETRIHNIKKVLESFKGLAVMPSETISFFDIIGEPSHENGWLTPPITTRNTELMNAFVGINQTATAIFNAAFRAGAKIIERHTHIYPAYYQDYGYGMDAYVKYGEKALIFKNTSDYPMFFDAYLCYSEQGYPTYVDMDIYSMPPGKNMYIASESVIEQILSPLPAEFIEKDTNTFDYLLWQEDEATGRLTAQYQSPRDGYIVRVYKIVYENGSQTGPGVWEGGEPVSKEEVALVEYPPVQEIIYTKPDS